MILDARRKRTAANAWVESIDPLNGLSIAQAKTIFNAARRHGSPLLQKIYSEIESSDPTLMTCVERRASALACLGWRAVADASAPDQDAAEEQRRALEGFADGIGNLDEAVEHLDLAFFRGFSVAQPIWEGGAVRHIELLDSWNFLLGDEGELLWNPGCSTDPRDCDEIGPEARVVALRRRRAIDWPALTVFLRKYIGERDWGRFTERYGIPPVDAVMAPNATQEQRGQYLEAVEAARDGRGVVWPSGSTVSRAEGARGQDPFTAFVEHQEKQIVLMATGGTLTSLAQADTGSLAGGAQMDVWEQIVSRDGVAISGALNRGLFLPFLRQRFPGARPMARIVLGREAEPTAEESAELAGKIRAAGYTVDQSQLEEATGFRLEKYEAPAGDQAGFGGFAPALNRQDPSSFVAKALQNARRGEGATDIPPDAKTRSDALLRDFAADMGPAAAKIKSLLDALDAGRDVRDEARKLAGELPDLMADDPAMAAVIEEAMAEAFAEGVGGEALANTTDANGAKHDNLGKFTGDGSGGQRRVEVGSRNTDTPEVQAAQIEKANAAFSKCLETHQDVANAFSRGDIGNIDVRWGAKGGGLRHLVGRRDGYAAAHPGEMDGRQTLGRMAETIVKGEVTEVTLKAGHSNVAIEHEGFKALLTRDKEGGNHWVLSGYEISEKGRGYRVKKARQG